MSSIIKNNTTNFKVRDISKNGVIKSYKDNLGSFNIKTSDDKFQNNVSYAKSIEDKGKNYKNKVIDTKKELLSNNSQTKYSSNIKQEKKDNLKETKEKSKRNYLSKKIIQNTENKVDNYIQEQEDLGIEAMIKSKQSVKSMISINKKGMEINRDIAQKLNSVINKTTSTSNIDSKKVNNNRKSLNKILINDNKKSATGSSLRKRQKKEINKNARKKAKQEVAKGVKAVVLGIKNLFVTLLTKKVALVGFLILVLIITIINSIMGVISIFAFSSNISLDDLQNDIAEYLTKKDLEINSQVENAQNTFTGYDEYIFNVPTRANTNQDLVYAFLKAKYGDKKISEDVMKAEIDVIHNNLYDLRFVPTSEVITVDENGEKVQKTKNILTVTLIAKSFTDYYNENCNELLSEQQQKEYSNIVSMIQENVGKTLRNPFPTENWLDLITSEFGYRNNPTGLGMNFHTGLDLAMPQGTEIHSSMSGTAEVVDLGNSSYGLHVIVTKGKYKTIYGHCSSVLVQNGQKVEAGEVIAKVGSTGNSTGPHLHLEYRVNNKCKNPKVYLKKGR